MDTDSLYEDVPVRDPSGGARGHDVPQDNEQRRAQQRRAVAKISREELEDKYLRLHDENLVLKKHARKQEEKIKKMATKLLRLVTDRKKQDQEVGGAHQRGRKGRDVETDEMIEDLQGKVRDLNKQNDMLKNKLTVTKQQLATQGSRQTPYPHVQSRVNTGLPRPPPPDNIKKGLRVQGHDRNKSATPRAFRTDVLPRYGHSLLEEAREENHRLEEMIQDLQDHIASLEQDKDILQEQVRIKEIEQEETLLRLKEHMSAGQRTNIHENVEMIRLQREVKEKSTKLTALQAKYANLEENLKTVKKSHDTVLAELEELNKVYQQEQSKVLGLKSEIHQSSSKERAIMELQERIGDIENEKTILQEANEKLLNSAFDAERERQYRANEKQLKLQIAQLEATLKGDLNDKNTLLDRLNEEREQYEKLQKENQQLQVNYYQVRQQLDELQDKMRFFTKESAIDFQELEEALIIVKKRKEKVSQDLEFLEKVDEEMNKDLKMQVITLQAEHAETVSELEKTRNMLILQHKINRDYQIEVEGATTRLDDYKQEYETKLEEYAQLLDIRAARIKKLERQLRDVAYGTKQYKVTDIADEDEYEEIDETVKLERGQNILELHISKISYSRDGLKVLGDDDPSTFVTYEFFEFELQSTPVVKGDRPQYDFTSQYKVTVDDFFLHHLMKGSTTLEVHQAVGTEFRTIAACQLRFRDLLEKPHGRVHGTAQLLGVESGRAGVNFGVVEFWVRLRVPMDQALRLFRERVKAMGYITSNTKAINQALATLDQPRGAQGGDDNTSGQQRDTNMNELTIKVVRCSSLKARREGVQPNPYVVYRFFDFNDHDTTIVTSSNSPEFNDANTYAVVMNAELDHYLKSEYLEVYVFDDTDPEDVAYLGLAKVPLISLAHDKAIRGTFELKQSNGGACGTIDIVLKWHSTYMAPKITSDKPKSAKPPSAPSTPSRQRPNVSSRPPIKPAVVSSPAAPQVTPLKQPKPLAASTPAAPRPETSNQSRTQEDPQRSRPQPRPRILAQTVEPAARKKSTESLKKPVIAVTPPPQEQPANLGLTQTLEEDTQPRATVQDSPFDSAEDSALDDVERELEGLANGKQQQDNESEDMNDVVAQEMRAAYDEEESNEKVGKTEHFDDTMFGDTSAQESRDFDEDDDSIGEEIDIPEPIEEEEEEEEYDQMEEGGAGDAGQEFGEDERDDNNMSSDSEALVVMSPAMNRPMSVAPGENTVSVTIFHLSLDADTPVINDDNVQRLYVEYHFLGLSAEETETPFSLPKTKAYQNLVFNFKKMFHVDAETHKLQRDYLASMLHPQDQSQGKIQLTVVSEPPEDSQDLECEEVGYAYVDVREMLEKGQDVIEQDIDIHYAKEESILIGTLNVSVECVAALRAAASEVEYDETNAD